MSSSTHRSNIIAALFTLLLMVGLILFKQNQLLVRDYHLSKLDATSYGVLEKIEPIEGIRQSDEGGTIYVASYQVYFQYFPKGVAEERMEIIQPNLISAAQHRRLKSFSPGDTIRLKTSSEDPTIARIWLGN